MKKADVLLMIGILVIAAAGYCIIRADRERSTAGQTCSVVVSVDGNTVTRLSLSEDQSYTIPTPDGESVLVIADGKCYMQRAHCPDQVCVRTHAISQYGENIICLPYKIVVTIEGDGETAYDN